MLACAVENDSSENIHCNASIQKEVKGEQYITHDRNRKGGGGKSGFVVDVFYSKRHTKGELDTHLIKMEIIIKYFAATGVIQVHWNEQRHAPVGVDGRGGGKLREGEKQR